MTTKPRRQSLSSPFHLSVLMKSRPSQRTASWWDAVHSLSPKRSRGRTKARRGILGILGKRGKEKGRGTENETERETGRGVYSLFVRLVTVSVSLWLSPNAAVSALTLNAVVLIKRCCVSDPWWTRDQIAHAWWWLGPDGELKGEDPGWEPDCVWLSFVPKVLKVESV